MLVLHSMNFLYPGFLFALFTLAIPIIIHLFNFRRYKKVAFSNVKFLKNVKERTQAQSQLKHLLVLIARLLALACLIFVFAQPIILQDNIDNFSGKKAVSIYLDNSFSMNALGDNGNLFETGRQFAYNISEAYGNADEIQLLSNNFAAEQQRLYSKEGISNLLDKAEISASFRDVNQIVTRQLEALNKSDAERKEIYLITDGQKNVFDDLKANLDSSISVKVIPLLPQPNGNIYIDSCWFQSPIRQLNNPEELMVRVRNASDEDRNGISLKLFLNETQKSLANVDVKANSFTDIKLTFTNSLSGLILGKLEINDYPITFDDVFYFQYNLKPNINVLVLSKTDTSNVFRSLFKTDTYFSLKQSTLGNIQYNEVAQNNLIILNDLDEIPSALASELNNLLENGGNICFIPNTTSPATNFNKITSFLGLPNLGEIQKQKLKVSTLNFEHPLYQDIFQSQDKNLDLPSTSKHFTLKNSIGFEVLMKLDNGDPFFLESKNQNGNVYLITSNLTDSASNFHRHALFVPTFFQMALKAGKTEQLYQTIGKDEAIGLSNQNLGNEEVIHIKNEDGSLDIIPEIRRIRGGLELRVFDQIENAGHYSIYLNDEVLGGLAMNYDRNESEITYLSGEEILANFNNWGIKNVELINEEINSVTKSIANKTNGIPLWQYFLLASILFFGIEMLLLRLLK